MIAIVSTSAGTFAVDLETEEVEQFDGVLEPEEGVLRPDRSRPGNGLELKRGDAARFAA